MQDLLFFVFQAGVRVLLDITASHVSLLSREDLSAVQDLLWLFYCQKLINVRNDCQQVNHSSYLVVVVVVVMTSLSGTAYMRGQRCPEEMRNSTRL